MVASRLVDLHTTSSKLQDLVLSEFPGLIFEEQHIIDDTDQDEKRYCFLDLPYSLIYDLIQNTKEPYELIDRQNNKPIASQVRQL